MVRPDHMSLAFKYSSNDEYNTFWWTHKLSIRSDDSWDQLAKANDEVEERVGSELLEALQEHRDRKKARVAPPSAYRSVKHVYSTTNIVEKSMFSRAKIVLSDLRNRMTPRHLEDVLYLRVNRQLWNYVTIQAIQPAPVAEAEGMQ
jgi:hypothetical protein